MGRTTRSTLGGEEEGMAGERRWVGGGGRGGRTSAVPTMQSLMIVLNLLGTLRWILVPIPPSTAVGRGRRKTLQEGPGGGRWGEEERYLRRIGRTWKEQEQEEKEK